MTLNAFEKVPKTEHPAVVSSIAGQNHFLSKWIEGAFILPWFLPKWPGHGFRGDSGGKMWRDTPLPAINQPRPRPRQELSCILHLGDSRSPNRQLITASQLLAPLPLCSAKCVMEMGPKQTSLPRGTLALSAEDELQGTRGRGLRCRGEFIKSMSFVGHLSLTLGCNTIFSGPCSEVSPS